MKNPDVLLSGEVATFARLSRSTVLRMFRSGELPGFRLGKRVWGMLLTELEKWLSSRGQKAVKS